MNDLHLGFGCTETGTTFLKALCPSVQLPPLRRLCLSRLKTRKAYVKRLIRFCKATLEVLRLEYITFDGYADDAYPITCFLVQDLHLKEVSLKSLNTDTHAFRQDAQAASAVSEPRSALPD
jgi:hypothetical protein